MEDINIEFLNTQPNNGKIAERIGSPFVFNDFDVRFGKRKRLKKFEFAHNIAKVDELLQEIDKLKSTNLELQQQLKSFQVTAQQVQDLYLKESKEHSAAKQQLDKLKKSSSQTEEVLENMSMVNDQLKARLAEYDGRPISYENLVVKYVKTMTKFESDDMLKHSQDRDLVEILRNYCIAMKFKVPPANCIKKSRTRGNKVKTQEVFVQCNMLEDSSENAPECSTCRNKPMSTKQNGECSKIKRDQASQYISTMITRQTNTEKIAQKHAQTMFPELPAVEDIIESYSKWLKIRSVSPLQDTPPRSSSSGNHPLQKKSTIGTCTMLCNIRRRIDYLPPNSSSNIKQEYFTPSASPTPNACATPISGPTSNSVSNNATKNISSSLLLNLFNSTTNSSLGQMSFSAFNELWQIFGKMLLSLIQNSTGSIDNTNQSSSFNQQQFLDWLLELYTNSQVRNASSVHTQTLGQRESIVSTSPLIFNERTVLSTNVLRPHPRKTLSETIVARPNASENENKESLSSNLIDNNANKRIPINNSYNISLESNIHHGCSTNNKVHRNILQTNDTCESIPPDSHRTWTRKDRTISDKKSKSKYTIEDQVQHLLPGVHLNKKKRKALNRLLKNANHRKKSYEERKNVNDEDIKTQSPVVILTNESNDDDATETAVDFLRTFNVAQENNHPIEEHFSESEKIFFKQISNKNAVIDSANTLVTEESTVIKPFISLTQTSSGTSKNIAKYTKSKSTKQIENQYQLLFGDSDNEEMENFKYNAKPVIRSTVDLESSREMCEDNECTRGINGNLQNINNNQLNTNPIRVESTDSGQRYNAVMGSESTIDNNLYQTYQISPKRAPQTTVANSENSLILNSSQEILSIPDIPSPILNDIELAYLPNMVQFETGKDPQCIRTDNNQQSFTSSLINKNKSFANNETSLENDLELSSDDCSLKEYDEVVAKINEVSKPKDGVVNEATVIHDTNNHIQENNRKPEISGSYEMSTLQDSVVQISKPTVQNSSMSLPNLNEDDDCSIYSSPEVIRSTTMYSSDLEKDFELSSDNESSMSEDEITRKATSKTFEGSESVALISSSVAEEENCTKKKNSLSLIENIELRQRNDKEHRVFKNHSIKNPSKAKTNSSQNKVEPRTDNFLVFKSDKECENLSQSEFKDNSISKSSFDGDKEHINKVLSVEQIVGLPNKSADAEQNLEIKDFELYQQKNYAPDLHKEFRTAQPLSKMNLEVESTCIARKIVQNIVDEKCSKQEDSARKEIILTNVAQNGVLQEKHILSKTREENDNTSEKKIPYVSENISEIEESSLSCSVITISDSSLHNEMLKNEEISETTVMKYDKDCSGKTPSLGALKLLNLNRTLSQRKLSNKLTANVKENKTKIGSQENSNEYKIINLENVMPPIFKNEVVTKKQHENINNNATYGNSLDSKINNKEHLVIPSCNVIKTCPNTNQHNSNGATPLQKLNTGNANDSKNGMYLKNLQKDRNAKNLKKCEPFSSNKVKTLFTQQNNSEVVAKGALEVYIHSNIDSIPNKVHIEYEPMDEIDEFESNDRLLIDDELMIDEEPGDISRHLQSNPLDISTILTESSTTLNSSSISTLLNSSLYNEILTESLNPVVKDILRDEAVTTSPENKFKRERKRKSECLGEFQPCKRSKRLKAKRIMVEEALNLSKMHIEPAKYINLHNNKLNVLQIKSPNKDDRNGKCKLETLQKSEIPKNRDLLQLGFFRERCIEDEMVVKQHSKTFNVSNTIEPEKQDDKTCTISEDIVNVQEYVKQVPFSDETADQTERILQHGEEWAKSCDQDDCVTKNAAENFIYTDSPQSPPPIHSNNDIISDTFAIIPLERPTDFRPHENNLRLFDVLINSYKNEYQKQVFQSVSKKELNRKENILKKFREQIMLYCYNEMDLDLYSTSTSVINKLLSISPDYNLIGEATIEVAKNAQGAVVAEKDLPSITQEMPPRHLSICLQRLFIFLKNIVTRNSNFCGDLVNNIERILFNPKQMESLSLQATLNLTQLFLMACKVEEYLQIPKHPARLFIAKCLYCHLQKSVLMIHEVLMWYPTVLPHREDNTYDHSDALISVIKQILMNTKYDMDKSDLRGKMLISKLRYEYHFEPFKPTQEEVINVLVEKLKQSKFYNISLSFGLLCKRIGVQRTQNFVLDQHLMPLANEYYSLALKTSEYDKRIEVLLEIISMVVKPLPIETDTEKYFSEFARFLNGFDRQIIQEAALCSILRLQRFNYEHCYNLLRHFQPTYSFNAHTQAMLKSYLYRRPLKFWKNLKAKNPINCN